MSMISFLLLLALFSISNHNPHAVSNGTFKILIWTKIIFQPPTSQNCKMTNPCIYTTDHNQFNSTDTIVYHERDIQRNDLLKEPQGNKINVFYSMEASPSLNASSGEDFWKVIKFNWVMAYMRAAHIRAPYGYLIDPETSKQHDFKPVGHFTKEQVMESKKIKGAIWFVSNCGSKERMNVYNALKLRFRVDIGGRCGDTNLCNWGEDCRPLISRYYFKLASENANCVDYVTEKFFDALPLPVIPIVIKRSVYEGVAPPGSFIAVDDFENVDKLADHLNYLMNNSDEYFKLFEWRNNWTRPEPNTAGYRTCEKLQQNKGAVVSKVNDLKQFYEENSKCMPELQQSWYLSKSYTTDPCITDSAITIMHGYCLKFVFTVLWIFAF